MFCYIFPHQILWILRIGRKNPAYGRPLHLLICEDSSNNTNKTHSQSHSQSNATVTASATATASLTATATDPDSFIFGTSLYNKKHKKYYNPKYWLNLQKKGSQFRHTSDMLFNQKSPVHVVPGPRPWHKHTLAHKRAWQLNFESPNLFYMFNLKSKLIFS